MDFEKICLMFTMSRPYEGIILSSMTKTPVPARICDTMAVTRSGNIFKLIYNPEFVEKLDTDTVMEALRHEVLHLCFHHFDIWKNKFPSEEEQYIRNIAADMEVNSYIDIGRMRGINPVTASVFGWENKLGTHEYYNRLVAQMQRQKQQQQAQQPTKPCNGGQGGNSNNNASKRNTQTQSGTTGSGNAKGSGQGNSNVQNAGSSSQNNGNQQPSQQNSVIPPDFIKGTQQFDDHSMWPDDDAEIEAMNQMVDDLMVFAADEVEKGRGSIPGEFVGKIEELRNRKKPKPVADWKRYVRRYLGNEFSEFIRKSRKKESRRFPDAPGNKHRRKSHILVAIDTSGSVSMPEYIEFFGQIRTLVEHATFHIVECDARIQYEYDYRGKPNMTLHGGGGTDFQEPIDLFNKDKRKYDALVYFTDGYCDIPANTPKDTLWVVSSKGDQTKEKYKVNGASVAFIPQPKQ